MNTLYLYYSPLENLAYVNYGQKLECVNGTCDLKNATLSKRGVPEKLDKDGNIILDSKISYHEKGIVHISGTFNKFISGYEYFYSDNEDGPFEKIEEDYLIYYYRGQHFDDNDMCYIDTEGDVLSEEDVLSFEGDVRYLKRVYFETVETFTYENKEFGYYRKLIDRCDRNVFHPIYQIKSLDLKPIGFKFEHINPVFLYANDCRYTVPDSGIIFNDNLCVKTSFGCIMKVADYNIRRFQVFGLIGGDNTHYILKVKHYKPPNVSWN